jgi:hypothetical protein
MGRLERSGERLIFGEVATTTGQLRAAGVKSIVASGGELTAMADNQIMSTAKVQHRLSILDAAVPSSPSLILTSCRRLLLPNVLVQMALYRSTPAMGSSKVPYFNRLVDKYGAKNAMAKLVRDDGSELTLEQLRKRYGPA